MRRVAVRLVAVLLLAACAADEPPPRADSAAEPPPPEPRFVDVTRAAGVRFTHFNDASPDRLLPETMGSGLAFFDHDGDGDPDVYFVNGAPLRRGRSAADAPSGALYANRGDGTFEDVTAAAGLTTPLYGMGAAVGDVDNDGHTDLLVTAVGGDRLYRNRGDGTFEDVSAAWGLGGGFSASAAFLDYDRDGFLDLYVTRYVEWSPAGDVRCSPDGVHRTYCTPEVYDGAPNRLYRNVGGRRFEDVTRRAGLWWPAGKSLGVAVFDADPDDWPDLVVANDTSRNTLYRNLGRGEGGTAQGSDPVRFEEVGVEAGIAYSESGATRGGMGVDAGDVDGDGLADVVIGNFAQEMSALYRARGPLLFIDDAAQRGVGLPTLLSLTFGALLFDRDGDGDLDLALANGHIEPEIAATRPLHRYAQPPQLFENRRGDDGAPGHFAELAPPPGDAFARELVGRGLAAADLDGDGDLDLGLTQNGGPARIFRNEADPEHWIRVRLVGTESNRTGYGARVRVVAGAQSWQRTLASGRSYLSASEPVLTFGLGDAGRIDRLEITWPSGRFQVVEEPGVNRLVTVVEE